MINNEQIKQLDQLIADELDEIIAIRHDLHAHPQLAFEETYASGVVQRELKKAGVAYQSDIAKTGVVGWIGQGEGVGLRADMDALPIQEQTDLPYASQNAGCMHACGHDGHTAVLIGAMRVLNKLRDQLPVPVKFIFQPAEEGGGGAAIMIKQGALSDSVGDVAVSRMFGLHGVPDLPIGACASKAGPMLAATEQFEITVTGVGCHAAWPQVGKDSIVCAASIVTALQTIVSRNTCPTDALVVSVTAIDSGNNYNVIPETARLLGTVRHLSKPVGDMAIDRVNQIVQQTASVYGCKATVLWRDNRYPVTSNDPQAYQFTATVARQLLGDNAVMEMDAAVMGGEDFSFFCHQVPSCFTFIGTRPCDQQSYPSLHHPKYDFTDDAVAVGMKLMCGYILASQG